MLPLDDRGAAVLFRAAAAPGAAAHRAAGSCTTRRSRTSSRTRVRRRSAASRSAVVLEHPAQAGDGALVARGNIEQRLRAVREGRPAVASTTTRSTSTRWCARRAARAPASRASSCASRARPDRSAEVTLLADGEAIGAGRIPRLLVLLSSTGMDLGRSLAPVNDDYDAPFAYPGRIETVTFELAESATPAEKTRGSRGQGARGDDAAVGRAQRRGIRVRLRTRAALGGPVRRVDAREQGAARRRSSRSSSRGSCTSARRSQWRRSSRSSAAREPRLRLDRANALRLAGAVLFGGVLGPGAAARGAAPHARGLDLAACSNAGRSRDGGARRRALPRAPRARGLDRRRGRGRGERAGRGRGRLARARRRAAHRRGAACAGRSTIT